MSKWTTEWPKKPGRYWFYGWPYGDFRHVITGKENPPELNAVHVWQVSNGVTYVREGHFWNKSEGAAGMFCEADVPEMPDVSGMMPKAKEKR